MEIDIEALRRMWEKDPAVAVEELQKVIETSRSSVGVHVDLGKFCEEIGRDGLALSEYQLALRDEREDSFALERLSVLYAERGDLEKALECGERRFRVKANVDALRDLVSLYLENDMPERAEEVIEEGLEAGVDQDEADSLRALVRSASRTAGPDFEEEEVVPSLGIPSDADVVRFLHLFSGRENVYAKQWWDGYGNGGYAPVRQPLEFNIARNHLLGSITVGVYPVRLDNTVTFFAVDVDVNKKAASRAGRNVKEARRLKREVVLESRRLASRLRELGIPVLIEDSGYKGQHLWGFLEEPVEAAVVRQFGSLFLSTNPVLSFDIHAGFFPVQARAGEGSGMPIKLPLGIHRRTGRRSGFLLDDGSRDPEPFITLKKVEKISRDTFYSAVLALKRLPVKKAEVREETGRGGVDAVESPAPPAPRPAWTGADFETNPEIAHILSRCHVLTALKDKVERERRLTHDEQIVLIHSMGHSSAGVLAVNYLFDSCVDVPGAVYLKTPLSGNPISCPKIRKRIPHITAQVNCNCSFDFAPDRYPNPRLHLVTLPEKGFHGRVHEKAAWDPVERARALAILRARKSRLEEEICELEKEILRYMEGSGTDRIDLEDRSLLMIQDEGGLPGLNWEGEDTSAESDEK